jgi:hypothetical protein
MGTTAGRKETESLMDFFSPLLIAGDDLIEGND